jgi:hypothetical protein
VSAGHDRHAAELLPVGYALPERHVYPSLADARANSGPHAANQHWLENLLRRPHRSLPALPLPGRHALPGGPLPYFRPGNSGADAKEGLPVRHEGSQLRRDHR